MKNTTKEIFKTTALVLGLMVILFGVYSKTLDNLKENAFNDEITSLRHESKRISELDHYTEFPEIYQEKQIKKLDKFVKKHKNLTANELYTLQGLTYENCDAYQEYWFTENWHLTNKKE